MYWDNLDLHDGGSRIDEIWLNHPRIREEANRQISGDPNVWPTAWFANAFAADLPLRSAVVIGCGTGAFERDLLRKNAAVHVTAIDVVGQPLRRATELAAAEGLQTRISYVQADATQYLSERPSEFDAIFFHASLHHFQPYEILGVVRRSLRNAGILYFDEYVGPSRHQWSPIRLLLPNLAYRLLARSLRRPHIVRAPINFEDPTEACASHQIMPAVHQLFRVVAVRSYGGNLLAVVFPNLHRPPAVQAETFERGVRRLLKLERVLLAAPRSQPYYAVVVARKEDAGDGVG